MESRGLPLFAARLLRRNTILAGSEGTEVWATWPENLAIEDTATYLVGPVLGLLLRLRGVTCLHASAVAFGEKAVAFVGSEGAGKSTTAAALARRGHAVLSDDVVALAERDGSFFVHPAYPYLCLWPESVQSLYGSAEALPQFSANYEKRCLSLGKQELRFEERRLPLSAIYILGERRGDPAPLVEELTPQKAFLALVANTFATNTLDSGCAQKNLKFWRASPPAFLFARFTRITMPPDCKIFAISSTRKRKKSICGSPRPARTEVLHIFAVSESGSLSTSSGIVGHPKVSRPKKLCYHPRSNGVSVLHDSAPSPETVGNRSLAK